MGNTPSMVPLAGQISQINIPLQCNTLNYFDTYPSVFSATAPINARPNQNTEYSDLASHITLPAKFATQALANGSDHFTADVELLYGAASSVSLNDNPVKRTFNQTWDNTTLSIFVPKIPFKVPSTCSASLYVQNIFISTYFRRPDGSVVTRIDTNCFANTNTILLITSGSDVIPTPGNGVEGKFPPIVSGQRVSVYNIPLSCNNNLKTNLIIGGVTPLKVKPNQEFTLSNFTSFFVLPGDLVKTLAKADSGIFVELKRPSDGQNATADGLLLQPYGLASNQSLELSRDFVPSETTPNPLNTGVYVPAGSDQPIQFGLPRTGSLSATVVAAQPYSFGLNVTSVNVVVSTYSLRTGELTDWRQYSCIPSPNKLFDTAITTASQ